MPEPIDDEHSMEIEERREGVVSDDEGLALSLDLEESEVASILKGRAEKAIAFWNKELDLDKVRKKAERYYLNKPYEDNELHEFQVPYKNNRILTSVETLTPMVTAQAAEPVVTEAQDSDESRQLAMDLQNVLLAMYEDQKIKKKLTQAVKHLFKGKRVAVLKYRFDPTLGRLKPDGTRKGAIVTEIVRPERIVFEQEADNPEDIPLIVEYLTATVEELVIRFPEKKDEIYKDQDIQRGVRSQLQKTVGYTENWFSFYDKEGNRKEGVAWKLNEVVLGFIANPNWNYDEYEMNQETGEYMALNFFDMPRKPYILFNHLNDGKFILDETSLIDNAIPMQDVLNRRGRQGVENADQATSGLVLNANMISPDDAAKLIGDPSEKILVDGDVRAAAIRLPANILPEYVIRDKYDARGEIDNIFGANAPIRGETSGIKTLGQEVISQRANMGRLEQPADSVEDGMTHWYQAMVQMMKVWWDDPEVVRFQMSAGKTRFINWDRSKIEDGVQVRVKAGSAMPKDKQAIRNETVQMVGILDPLSIAEGLDKENPKEFAKRIVYYRFFMDRYLEEVLDTGSDGVDPNALADIHSIMQGQQPTPPEQPDKEYLATMQMFLESEGFKRLEDPATKQELVAFAQTVNDIAKTAIGEGEAAPVPGGEEVPSASDQGAAAPVETPGAPSEASAPPAAPAGGGNLFQKFFSGVGARLGIK